MRRFFVFCHASLSKQLLIHSIAFSAPPAVLPYDDAVATLGNIQHQVLRFIIPSRIKENSEKCPFIYRARELNDFVSRSGACSWSFDPILLKRSKDPLCQRAEAVSEAPSNRSSLLRLKNRTLLDKAPLLRLFVSLCNISQITVPR